VIRLTSVLASCAVVALLASSCKLSSCKDGSDPDPNTCRCKDGEQLTADDCGLEPSACPDGFPTNPDTCTCRDGTKLSHDECDLCAGLDAIDLGTARDQDFEDYVRSLCERPITFALDENAVLRLRLTAGAQAVALKLAHDTSTKTAGQVSAPAGAEQDLVLSLPAGTYRALVTTQAAEQVNFALSMRVEPRIPAEPSPDPGTRKEDAQEVGDPAQLRVFGGYVGDLDGEDYYRVDVPENAVLTYGLSDVSGRVAAQLYQDASLIDENRPYSSIQGATDADAIQAINLENGTYYLRVIPVSGGHNFYTLRVSAEAYETVEHSPEPANDWQDALDLGLIPAKPPLDIGGYVGGTDTEDFYEFELEENSALTYTFGNVLGRVVGQLYAAETQLNLDMHLDRADVAQVDYTHTVELPAGAYFMRVTPYSGTNSLYTLTLSAVPQ
jgi:hypothetical protein